MATLREVLAALLPEADAMTAPPTDDAGGAASDDTVGTAANVGWVRVLRARVPALDVLDEGDVVIVPEASLAVVAPGGAELRDLVVTLGRSGAAGILFVPAGGEAGVEGGDGGLAADLAGAARDARLPAFRLDGTDPATLERRLIGYLVDRRGELERQASLLEADLARLAMASRGLDALAAEIASFLRRAVALEGRRGDALAVHAPVDVPEAASAVAAYLAGRGSVGRRMPLPGAPGETTPAGWLVLLGDRPPSDLEAVATERIAPLLSLELVLEAQVLQARDEAGRGEALPSDGPPWIALVARQEGAAEDGPSREDVRRELRFRFAARRFSLRGTSDSVELRAIAALEADDRQGIRIAGQVAGFLGRPVAVSRPFTEPAARPAEEAAARAALEAAERLPEPPAVARTDRLPAYRLLGALGNLPDGRVQAAAMLEPLLAGRPASVRQRLATLRAVLDHPAAGEAAAALGIHRNTLAYRVRNLEAATGWDLTDPELRLALSMAVRLVQSAQD